MNWWIDVTNKIFHKTHFLSNLDYDILIFQASTSRAGKSINDEAVFIKKFPRYEDVFCLGVEERSRSLKMDNALPVNMTDTIGGNNLENFQRSEFGLIIFKNILNTYVEYFCNFPYVLQSLYYKTGSFKYIAMYLNDRYA